MEKTPTSLAPNEISDEIASVSSASVVSWTRIGALIDRVDREEYWRSESSSFTEWVKSFAAKLGLKDGSVWRMLTASRFYIKLQADLSTHGFPAPSLNDLDDSVSPEKLELLEKISRVADRNVTVPLSIRVIDDSITRTAIRSIWEAYRPVLAGRTARGRGTYVPRIDESDVRQFDSLMEARVMLALQEYGPRWTGSIHPNIYKLFRYVRLQVNSDKYKMIEFDVVAVIRETETSPLVFHGIDIRSFNYPHSNMDRIKEITRIAKSFCDFYWIATSWYHEADTNLDTGLLVVSGKTIEVRFAASRGVDAGTRTGELTKALLLQVIKN